MKILQCRRTVVALSGLACLLILGLARTMSVAEHIVAIVVAVCAANASQAVFEKKA